MDREWLKLETIGEIDNSLVELIPDAINTIYATEYQLPVVQFEIDGISYVAMRKQDFVDWYGE